MNTVRESADDRAVPTLASVENLRNVLPLQLISASPGTPRLRTGETANMLLLGRELRLPHQLVFSSPSNEA